jgi:hypothetical protein
MVKNAIKYLFKNKLTATEHNRLMFYGFSQQVFAGLFYTPVQFLSG